MKIGWDARLNYYRLGGSAEYTARLVEHIPRLDAAHDYRVVQHIRHRETFGQPPAVRRLNTLTPAHHRLERWALAAELAPYRLDLLHSPDSIMPRRVARRHVITIHDVHYLHYPQFMTPESLRYYGDQIARSVAEADHILVSSGSTRADLAHFLNVPAEKVTVHALGVNAAFKPLPINEVDAVQTRLRLPAQYFLFVGTYEPRKNITGLLSAYDQLRRQHTDVPPLVLAGRRGWLFEDIFTHADRLNLGETVVWLEDVAFADLPAVYNGARLLALPSHYEGFGLTALEAMACGTPVIVSDRGSLPEVVGETGLLVDPDDPAALADAMHRLWRDDALHATLRRGGLAHAQEFTWQRTAQIVLDVYNRLLSLD